jgi:hypothetical protein
MSGLTDDEIEKLAGVAHRIVTALGGSGQLSWDDMRLLVRAVINNAPARPVRDRSNTGYRHIDRAPAWTSNTTIER